MTELIEGLRSGEIALDTPATETGVSPSEHQAMASSYHLLPDAARPNPNAEFMLLLSRDFWHAINQNAIETDIKLEAATPVDRVWLLIGESKEQTAEVLWSLGSLASGPARQEVRCMITSSMNSERMIVQLKHHGLGNNVRVIRANVRGWLAFTDQKAYCYFQESEIETPEQGGWWFLKRKRRNDVLLLDGNVAANSFRTLETYYEQLWESASPTTK